MKQFRIVGSMALAAALAGCATLPTSGPTGNDIRASALEPDTGAAPIRIVEVVTAADIPPTASAAASLDALPDIPPPPTDMIGPGDVLEISIYEAGVTLFAPSGPGSAQAAAAPGVQRQALPPSRVNDSGEITIPYAGTLRVMGRTVAEAEEMIRLSLRGLSQNPQVRVSLSEALTNTVIVSGEVARPGRLVLQTNRETLSDVIALAGGYRGTTRDLVLRIMRRGDSVDIPLNDVIEDPGLDVRAYPGDRLMLINSPRTFSVLGAPGQVSRVPFATSAVSLAEAVASVGGVNPVTGDPAAIFLFRYVTDDAGAEVPVVYHLNMMETQSYFLAQRFAMRDKDVLYFGNARANQPSKLVQLISQLFSPILTVTSAVSVVQNSN
ncbi:polysaccharide biosynthesis/export family protein [Croceibacterium mercuriale]|nr:polysaccharide biosynthesis/export family protein [Croceibacterium mercuriale]